MSCTGWPRPAFRWIKANYVRRGQRFDSQSAELAAGRAAKQWIRRDITIGQSYPAQVGDSPAGPRVKLGEHLSLLL